MDDFDPGMEAENLLKIQKSLDSFTSNQLRKLKATKDEFEKLTASTHFNPELAGVASYIGKIPWDIFYQYFPDKDDLREGNNRRGREETNKILRSYGYDGNIYPRLTVADEGEEMTEENRAIEAGSNILQWWTDIRNCLSQEDSKECLDKFFSLPAPQRRQLFEQWATELQVDFRIANPAAATWEASTLPEKNRPDLRLFCDVWGGHQPKKVDKHTRWEMIQAPTFQKGKKPPDIKVHPTGDEAQLNPSEMYLLAPLLNWENLSNQAFLASFVYNRARYHPACFVSRDFDSSYVARSLRLVKHHRYIENYIMFSHRTDVRTYPYPYPLQDLAASVTTVAGADNLRRWQGRGQAYSHAEGRTILLTQLYMYGFIHKLVRYAMGQLSLPYNRNIQQVRTNPVGRDGGQDDDPWPAVKARVDDLLDEERQKSWYNDADCPYSHSVRMGQYLKPTTVDLEHWKTMFEGYRDAAIEHLWKLTSDLAYFRDQALVQADHHYGQIKVLSQATIDAYFKKAHKDEDHWVRKACPESLHFHHDKKKRYGEKTAKPLENQVMDELTKRLLWCAVRDLESWENLYHLTDRLSTSLRDGGVDLSDPNTRLKADQMAYWVMLQQDARAVFGNLLRELNPRCSVVSSPHLRNFFGKFIHPNADPKLKHKDFVNFPHDLGEGHFAVIPNGDPNQANLLDIRGAEQRLAAATNEADRARLTEEYETAIIAMVLCQVASYRMPMSMVGCQNISELILPAVESAYKAGNFSQFVTDIVVHIGQVARFVGEMEETRRMCPRKVKHTALWHRREFTFPHHGILLRMRSGYVMPNMLQHKDLRWLFRPVLKLIDTKESKKERVAEQLREEGIKKEELFNFERVWLSIINNMTGVQVEALEDYRTRQNSEKLVKAHAEGVIGTGLCKFLLRYHHFLEHGKEGDDGGEDEGDDEGDEADGEETQGVGIGGFENPDADMTGISDSEDNDYPDVNGSDSDMEIEDYQSEDEAEPLGAMRPEKRVRPTDSKFLKDAKRKKFAARRGGGRGGRRGGMAARGPDATTSKVKLKRAHWDTFAALLGKNSAATWDDICKAMAAIGFSVTPQGGSMHTVRRTDDCAIPSSESRHRSTVVHRIHQRDEGNRPDIVRALGNRFVDKFGITRKCLSKYFEGGPGGGWR